MTAAVATVLDRYVEEFAGSRRRFETAREIFPSGVTHDLRRMEPFPIYIERQFGCHKWDVDGHEFIDFWGGHGAMLLGHSHPAIVSAVQEQVARMTHAGGCHELEIQWAECVRRLIPSAEKVRFTSSGTEATLMALRLCRMFTGKPKVLKFAGHFHGWHDFVAPASDPPYDSPRVPGIPDAIADFTVIIPPNDVELLERTLIDDPMIGAVILEPTGGHWGQVPIRGPFLRAVRDRTRKLGRLMICDEVITGFRVSPGGAQLVHDVRPDLTTLAKILAGGLPGGALVGRAEILDQIEVRPGKPKMRHPGTYNGNPLSAAAGIAALTLVETGEPTRQANAMGRLLRNRLNEAFTSAGLNWTAYGDYSLFRLVPNDPGPRPEPATGDDDGYVPFGGSLSKLDGPMPAGLAHAFRRAVLLEGVDMPGLGGFVMSAHTANDIEAAVRAIVAAACAVTAEGFVS